MADLVFVAIALAFFALSGLYVLACDRIIGRADRPSESASADASSVEAECDDAPEGVAR